MPIGDELDDVSSAYVSEFVYRVTLDGPRRRRFDLLKRELGTGQEFLEALEFLGAFEFMGADDLIDVLHASFQPPYRTDTRYSDGSFGVLYTSLEPETSAGEYAYWAPTFVPPRPGLPILVRLPLIRCRLQGEVKDVRHKLAPWPWLVADEYSNCRILAQAAITDDLDGLFTPSARKSLGTTVPIFSHDAVSLPNVIGQVTVSIFSDGTTKVTIT